MVVGGAVAITLGPMDPVSLLLTLAAVAALVLVFRWFSGPHIVVRIADGRAVVARGKPPARLVHDLDDVARRAPDATGRVEVSGRGDALRLRVAGLEEPLRQRVRNVTLLHRERL